MHLTGDFGILIAAGTGRRRAMLLNFLSGITAMIGVVVGIEAGTKANNWCVKMVFLFSLATRLHA
jgi:zinc transporter ZupT